MTRTVPRVHAVTNARILAVPDLASRAAALAADPRVALHCRHPRDARAGLSILGAFRRAGPAAVLMNDRADVAVAADADGVHLPAAGLATPDARGLAGPERLVGRSTHTVDEVRAAEGCDYVFFGPIWPSASHPERAGTGLDLLRVAASVGPPVVAVGGITPERVADCLAAGAWGVGAVRALWEAEDPGSAVRAFLLSFE